MKSLKHLQKEENKRVEKGEVFSGYMENSLSLTRSKGGFLVTVKISHNRYYLVHHTPEQKIEEETGTDIFQGREKEIPLKKSHIQALKRRANKKIRFILDSFEANL